jgi:hypothetical protein
VARKPPQVLTTKDVSSITDHLAGSGIRYADPNFERNILLPLNVYDDKSLAFRQPDEWGKDLPLWGVALHSFNYGETCGVYEKCVVQEWDSVNKHFIVRWKGSNINNDDSQNNSPSNSPSNSKTSSKSRSTIQTETGIDTSNVVISAVDPLHVYFEGEDLQLYCQRVSQN